MEADEGQPEVDLAQLLVEHATGHLREPEVHAGVGREHDGSEKGVVEVGDHEVGVRDVEVQRGGRQHDAGQTTEQEGREEADGEDHRGLEGDPALPHGAEPVEELQAGRDRDEEGHEAEERQQHGTRDEHVVGPHGQGQSGDRQGRENQADVAEHRLTGEDREDLGHDTEERQGQDVDLGVTEEPEQVLPQDRATVGRVVDVAAEETVVEDAEGRSGEQREDEQGQQRGHQDVPGEDRHAEHGHTRRTEAEDGGHHVDGRGNRTDTTDADTDDPEVGTDTRGVDGVRQRHVEGPAEVTGTTGGEEAGEHDDAAPGRQPEAQRVEAREGDVGGTDLQGHDVVRETPHDRGAVQQEHHRAVHGEELVELLVGQVLHARVEELHADQQCHEATDEEEAERHDDVHDAELLVVGGRQHGPGVVALEGLTTLGSRPCGSDRMVFPRRYCGHSILLTTRSRSSGRLPLNELHGAVARRRSRHLRRHIQRRLQPMVIGALRY